MTVDDILAMIRDEAMMADRRAEEACMRSKYSVQDYWICIEMRMASLHDRIARAAGVHIRCPRGRFSARLLEFKRQTQLLAGRFLPSPPEPAQPLFEER